MLRNQFAFDMELISQWGQGVVGVTLVLIGGMGVKEAMQLEVDGDGQIIQSHSHSHGTSDSHEHSHLQEHSHTSDGTHMHAEASYSTTTVAELYKEETARRKNSERKFTIGTYFTGVIHGLQPDALLILLPALALPSVAAAAYLVTFLVGTVMAMASYTFFLGVSSSALAKMRGGADTIKKVSGAAALIALGVGISLIINAALGR